MKKVHIVPNEEMTDFPDLENDILLRAAFGRDTPRTPLWIMRQAGRNLPEYRALREKHEFFDVVRTPELAAEVRLQPLERFELDAAIIFCDFLVVPQALGLTVEMVPGKGPHFPEPVNTPGDLDRLRPPSDLSSLQYVFDALTLTRRRLQGRAALIGFAGAPWALMAYMIEGGSSKNFKTAKSWLFRHPEAAHELLQALTDVVARYLEHQVRAGAQAVQVFDSWAGLLGPREFRTFILPYLRQIAEHLEQTHPETPRIIFAKGAHYALQDLAGAGYHVISIDWTMDPGRARRAVGTDITLQGNLDPSVLYAQPEDIRKHVRRMLDGFGARRHIANLGHGMHPGHDPDHVRVLVEAVREYSASGERVSEMGRPAWH